MNVTFKKITVIFLLLLLVVCNIAIAEEEVQKKSPYTKEQLAAEMDKIDGIFEEVDVYIKSINWRKWYLDKSKGEADEIAKILIKHGYTDKFHYVRISSFSDVVTRDVIGVYIEVIIRGKIAKGIWMKTEWWNEFDVPVITPKKIPQWNKGKQNVKSTRVLKESYV